MKSSQIIYSEHDYDECFSFKDGSGRVPEGDAVGFMSYLSPDDKTPTKLVLFDDICYCENDHAYWNNLDLENDIDRLILP